HASSAVSRTSVVIRSPNSSGLCRRPSCSLSVLSRSMRSASPSSGSPQNNWTSASAADTRSAAADAPPKYSVGCVLSSSEWGRGAGWERGGDGEGVRAPPSGAEQRAVPAVYFRPAGEVGGVLDRTPVSRRVVAAVGRFDGVGDVRQELAHGTQPRSWGIFSPA